VDSPDEDNEVIQFCAQQLTGSVGLKSLGTELLQAVQILLLAEGTSLAVVDHDREGPRWIVEIGSGLHRSSNGSKLKRMVLGVGRRDEARNLSEALVDEVAMLRVIVVDRCGSRFATSQRDSKRELRL